MKLNSLQRKYVGPVGDYILILKDYVYVYPIK